MTATPYRTPAHRPSPSSVASQTQSVASDLARLRPYKLLALGGFAGIVVAAAAAPFVEAWCLLIGWPAVVAAGIGKAGVYLLTPIYVDTKPS